MHVAKYLSATDEHGPSMTLDLRDSKEGLWLELWADADHAGVVASVVGLRMMQQHGEVGHAPEQAAERGSTAHGIPTSRHQYKTFSTLR